MKPTVLFVDDDQLLLNAFMRSFHKEPFMVYTAQSAEEAQEILKRTTINMVVSDEAMRGMKGTELMKWVAEYYPEMPRIILTGQPSFPSIQSAINEAGVFRYLTKPIDYATLALLINDTLKNEVT